MGEMAASQNNFDEDDWTPVTPPNEAEQKVIEARRERNNKISLLMGQYLLKGYKMLATTCCICECILMEDRQKVKYCIACSEIDADSKKDNPAVSEQAARRTVEENLHRIQQQQNTSSVNSDEAHFSINTFPNQIESQNIATEVVNQESSTVPEETLDDLKLTLHRSALALKNKLDWATKKLQSTNGIQDSIQLVSLISNAASALHSIKRLSE